MSGLASRGSLARSDFALRGFGAPGVADPAGFGTKVDPSTGKGGGRRVGSCPGRLRRGGLAPGSLGSRLIVAFLPYWRMTSSARWPHDVSPACPALVSIVSLANTAVK